MTTSILPQKDNSVNFNGSLPDYMSIVPAIIPPVDQAAQREQESAERIQQMLLNEGTHDEGNAQCVHALFGGKFVYNDAFGWGAYNGKFWETDGRAEAILDRAIVETMVARQAAAARSGDPKKHKDIFAKCQPTASVLNGTKSLLKSLVYAPVSEFDNEPDVLNCQNGVVDLRTGEITPHSPNQRFTYCVTVDYKPNADQTEWKEWLVDAVDSKDVAEWMQEAGGYTLTGHTREEVLFYIHGPSRSGKGTYTEAMMTLLGEHLSAEVEFSTFTAKRDGNSQNFDLAPLRPCRFVSASESNAYERFNEGKVKLVTGGNSIQCAFKHKTHFNYRPQFKIWLSSNHPVNADPDDEAVWGRIRVIEFPKSRLGKEDKTLKRKMKSKKMQEAILAWAVEGAIKWYARGAQGLPELESSAKIKKERREELDTVQQWLNECCEKEPGAWVENKIAYASYEKWCNENGVKPKLLKSLSEALSKKFGITVGPKTINGKSYRGYFGITI